MFLISRNYKNYKLFGSIVFILVASAICSPHNQVRADTMVLNAREIEQKIQTIPGWELQGNAIARTFKFPDFVTAIAFVNKLVEPAESAGHHPDIAISYNKVSISLTTHDAGGITQQDFDLAAVISKLAE